VRKPAISRQTVDEIHRLSDAKLGNTEIARQLKINRLHVAAILAYRRELSNPMEASLEVEQSQELSFDTQSTQAGEPEQIAQQHPNPSATPETEDARYDGIYVGDELEFSDVPVTWEPANQREVQNPHLMLIGESGSGKTYAQQCLVAELAAADIPSIIFDYGQSFEVDKLDLVFRRYCNPQEYLIGEEGLTLNPLEISDRDSRGPSSVATRLADVFDAAYHLGDIQRKVLIDAIIRTYRDCGIVTEDRESWLKEPPRMAHLSEAIEALAADRVNYHNHRNAASLSARLMTFFMLASFQKDKAGWSWDMFVNDARKRVHILQFRGLEGKTQRVLVEMLLWHFFSHFRGQGQKPLRVFCILDEAHHLSFREDGPLAALLREARKFGLGIIFASQQPEDFSSVAFGNSASKLIFQTSDPALRISKFLAAKCQNYDRPETIQEAISGLEQGNAFFITRNRGKLIRVTELAKRSTFWSPKNE
jgi:hypothetical protein